jgi:hypothetical protein
MRKIAVDALPEHSEWVKTFLLVHDKTRLFEKTSEGVKKEYEVDKWGVLYDFLEREASNWPEGELMNRVTEIVLGEKKTNVFWDSGEFYLADSHQIYKRYLGYIESTICRSLGAESSQLVDLGAGYGAFLLSAGVKGCFHDSMRLTALELTDSGRKCGIILSNILGVDVGFYECDFLELRLGEIEIEEESVFFSSWAFALIKGFPRTTLMEILRKKPIKVIHIEPFYESWSSKTLRECLWRRYVESNDYNKTLLSDLRVYESEGLLKITKFTDPEFGPNGLCPLSVLEWEPL